MIRARPLRPRIGQTLSSQAQRGQGMSEPVRCGRLPGQNHSWQEPGPGHVLSGQSHAGQERARHDPGRAWVSLDQVLAVRTEPSGPVGARALQGMAISARSDRTRHCRTSSQGRTSQRQALPGPASPAKSGRAGPDPAQVYIGEGHGRMALSRARFRHLRQKP